MNDLELRQNVMDELEFTPGIDAAHIGVVVVNGVVTLSGHVPAYAQKGLIDETVRRVKGVHGIAEEIEVRFLGAAANSDEDIVSRALLMIAWNTFVPEDAVRVQVQKGWVTLSGKVEWQYQRREVVDAVRRLAGVSGISNQIEVTPHVSAVDVKAYIEKALKRAAEVDASRIHVDVLDGGKVKLQGQVHDWMERAAVERAAWSAPGVREVQDLMSFT